jgi:hypothetical protein
MAIDEKPQVAAAPEPMFKKRVVKLSRPHGFIDDYGAHRFWKAGEIVGDPATVQLLTDRGATIEDVA